MKKIVIILILNAFIFLSFQTKNISSDGSNIVSKLFLDAWGDTTDITGTFDGQEGSYYLSRANHTGTIDTTSSYINNSNWETYISNHSTSSGTSNVDNGTAYGELVIWNGTDSYIPTTTGLNWNNTQGVLTLNASSYSNYIRISDNLNSIVNNQIIIGRAQANAEEKASLIRLSHNANEVFSVDTLGNVYSDKNITATTYGSNNITDTELGYLDGVTSNIQTQIDAIDSNILFATDTLSSTDVNNLGSAQTLIAAPGLGKALLVTECSLKLIVSTQLEVGTQDLNINYSSSQMIFSLDNLKVETSSIAKRYHLLKNTTYSPELSENTALTAKLSGGTNPSSGSVQIVYNILYKIIDY